MGLAATWFLLLGASWVYGITFLVRLDAISFGLMAIALLGIGHSLRTGTTPDMPIERAADSTQ